jgi:hypothetical protein
MSLDSISQVRAKREYEAIKAFYIHIMVFVPVMLLLVLIDSVGGGDNWWHWVALGWGAGVLAHGYAAFVLTPRQMAKWEEEQVAKGKPSTTA